MEPLPTARSWLSPCNSVNQTVRIRPNHEFLVSTVTWYGLY